MLISDLHTIGGKIYEIRKRKGLFRGEVAEKAGISERTYADIERGVVNARIQTFLAICEALDILPDEVLTDAAGKEIRQKAVLQRLQCCSDEEAAVAMELLSVYLKSLEKIEEA